MRAYQKPLLNAEISKRTMTRTQNCVKSVRLWSFSGPYFPAFSLKTERYGVKYGGKHGPEKLRIRTLFTQYH